MKMKNVIEVNSFLEAAGILLALRKGISVESLRRPLSQAKEICLKNDYQAVAKYVSREEAA